MRITPLGLPVESVTVDQALDGSWRSLAEDADVVRVQDPPLEQWADLARAGFHPKPQVIMWRTRVLESEQEYLSRLPGKDRYDIRAAVRKARASGLRITMEPLTSKLLDEFLELYAKQISTMRHGWQVAVEQRERILAEMETFFVIGTRDTDTLVGACLCQDLPEQGEVRARFSAVTPGQRNGSLARVLYGEVVHEGRRRRRPWATLGRDINLYGHVGTPGLFSFKSRLGFTVVPAQIVEPGSGSHQADRVTGFHELADPALLLSYAPHADGRLEPTEKMQLEIYTSDANLDIRPLQNSGLAGLRVHHVAPRTVARVTG